VLNAITPDAAGKIEYHYTLVEIAADWKTGEAAAADDALAVQWVKPEDVATICAWSEIARIVRLSMLQRIL